MSKFNKKSQGIVPNSRNVAGGESFKREDVRQEIVTLLLNSILAGNSFYEKEKSRIDRIIEMVRTNAEHGEFLSKAMVYARNDGNLRSVSHVVATALVENIKGVNYLRPALYKTLVRTDDAIEMTSLFLQRNPGVKVPNVLQRAIVDALETKWDEYQLKKYASTSKEVKLKDLIKMFRPNPTNLVKLGKAKDKDVFKRVIEDKLDNIQTAQTVNAEYVGKDRKNAYKEMLKTNTLGYMAALKNLVNILESGIGEKTIQRLCDLLENKKAILGSRVLPFRFVQAYNEVEKLNIDKLVVKQVLKSIDKAFGISAGNVAIVKENEKVALLLDESSSMGSGDKSPFTIGKTLMASMLCGLDKSKTLGYLWATKPREVSIDESPMKFVKNTHSHGGGTALKAAFEGLINSNTYVDKIVIFTDQQGWNDTYRDIRNYIDMYKKINKNVKILFWNLEGYQGGTPLKLNDDILEVCGYSDKLLEVISNMWEDKDALIKKIESIKLV